MEKRVISTDVMEEDYKIENSLRPKLLRDYIGQKKAKENLKVFTTFCYMARRDSEKRRLPVSSPMRWGFT